MAAVPINRVLISVFDKTGLDELVEVLRTRDAEIIASGGTAEHLRGQGVVVTEVAELTSYGAMLGGRVKTLHPAIHAGILARRGTPDDMEQLAECNIRPIDMVVVDLYPFEQTRARAGCTEEDATEMIDIGGPCLLRAAAKNHRDVVVVPGQDCYASVAAELRTSGTISATTRRQLAARAFRRTALYDAVVARYWTQPDDVLPQELTLGLRRVRSSRYGENPQQAAAVYVDATLQPPGCNLVGPPGTPAEIPGDRDPSYNNYADAHAAVALCRDLSRACAKQHVAVFVKHGNPCGVGVADDAVEAYRLAYLGDPHAAMGGVLATNTPVDALMAETALSTLERWGRAAGAGSFFIEVWAAPAFDDGAVTQLRAGKPWAARCRLFAVGDMAARDDALVLRRIAGGILVQTPDHADLAEQTWICPGRRPDEREYDDLRIAWLTCKHTGSNAISIVRNGMLLGSGAGQTSRVMSCRLALWLAEHCGHAAVLPGAVAASDGFFPFSDGPQALMAAGISAIIQPGGSRNDDDTIAACDQRNVALVLTGTRHFKH